MSDVLTRAKLDMLAEFEREGGVRVDVWVDRYPAHRTELLDYAFWLEVTAGIEDAIPDVWEDHSGVVSTALQAVTQMLKSNQRAEQEQKLAESLIQGRRMVQKSRGKGTAPVTFRRAAVYAWTFDQARREKEKLSRFRTVKTVYFLEHGLNLQLFTQYKKKAAGPYDPDARYRDAEPIGEDKGWIRIEGSQIALGENIRQARKYAPRYVRAEKIAEGFVRFLARLTDKELETWATVHMAAHDLSNSGKHISVESIRQVLAGHPDWKPNLNRAHFQDSMIGDALQHLSRLGLLPERQTEVH